MTGRDLPDGAHRLADQARELLTLAGELDVMLATAESCTGGLVASLLTDIEGCSGRFERGFVTYTEEAKHDLLGIAPETIAQHGAVSAVVARAMVQGALDRSRADLACAITGFAGKGQDPADEAGLVYIAAARRGAPPRVEEFHFGDIGREEVRHRTAAAALDLLRQALPAR